MYCGPLSAARMNRTMALATSVLLVTVFGGSCMLAYGSYSTYYTPTFGGGQYHYADGLVINGKSFDISGYSQKIQTQNLTVGVPSNITLKIFDNSGSYSLKSAAIFLNIRGPTSSVSNSDTWMQYDMSGKTVIEDPHHFIDSAKGRVDYSGKLAFVTFVVIPRSDMKVSDFIVSSTDSRSSTGYSLVVDAVSFTGKSSDDPLPSNVDYLHSHCTASHPCQQVCGDHICKPGEKPVAKP